jgi:hypothetical protein
MTMHLTGRRKYRSGFVNDFAAIKRSCGQIMKEALQSYRLELLAPET